MKCKRCEKQFNRGKGNHKYCLDCKNKRCIVCAEPFSSIYIDALYCSRSCVGKREGNAERLLSYVAGVKQTAEQIEKRIRSGEEHYNWQGGITEETRKNANKKRTEMLRSAEGSHSDNQWWWLKESTDFSCVSCKKKEPEIKLTKDHIKPISKGGSDLIENIQPLCSRCNSVKNTKEVNYICHFT